MLDAVEGRATTATGTNDLVLAALGLADQLLELDLGSLTGLHGALRGDRSLDRSLGGDECVCGVRHVNNVAGYRYARKLFRHISQDFFFLTPRFLLCYTARMRTITMDEAVPALIKVIAENPDRVVTTCHYTDEYGNPDCVVGHWLDLFNIERPSHDNPTMNGENVDGSRFQVFLKDQGVTLEPRVRDLLAEAQAIQDGAKARALSLLGVGVYPAWSEIIDQIDWTEYL